MRARTVPPPTFSGDAMTSLDAEPLEAVDGADDVDDRIERADLVQVHPLDRRVVDRGLRLGEPLEQLDRAILALRRKRRPPDGRDDVLEVMVLRDRRRRTRPSDFSISRNFVAATPARLTRSAVTSPYSIARLPSASRSASSGSPRSSRAPRIMSPDAPEKQSKYNVANLACTRKFLLP